MAKQVEALIAGACLSGTNTRRVKRARAALFGGAVGKGVVSRPWRQVRTDGEAWNGRDGQKVLRAVKAMGGESEAAWRGLLDDLIARGRKVPEFPRPTTRT